MARQKHNSKPDDNRVRGLISREHVDLLGASLWPCGVPKPGRSPGTSGTQTGTPEAVDAAFSAIAMKLRPTLQSHLNTLVGCDFGREANAELARAITKMLSQLNCGLRCPCGEPARAIRYARVGSSYVFRLEHTEKRRHGATTTLPLLQLVQRNAE